MKTINLFLVIILILSEFTFANEKRVISGLVTDSNGNPLPGVTITDEKLNRGTISDVNGMYKIEVVPTDKFLVFSFIGMETKKVRISKENIINVTLKASPIELLCEDVVSIGFAQTKNMKLTSAVPRHKSGNIMIRGLATTENWNTENYSTIHENGFKNVHINPLSTFSLDVDNASYSNVRRFINQGIAPPVDAVRIEEMINYFSYDYSEPQNEHPFHVSTELSDCPWNSDNYLLHIGLKGKSIDKEELPPSNLVFLLDVSGSMQSYNKLPLLKRAYKMLVNELRPSDRVAIVVYAGAAGKVLDSTPGDEKKTITDALDKLSAGGSTAGGEGLKLAYKIAQENFIENGNNRIILATDGDFNVGVSSTSEMERLVEKERENGVFITVLGFGMGNYKDDKMEVIANKGNGNYTYIDNIHEARKVFINEFGGTLFTIAKDVKFQLEFNPAHVESYRLVGYENRLLNEEDFNDDKKDAGEMGAGHTVTALYEIVPANSNKSKPKVDPLKYQEINPKGDKSSELLTIKLRYKKPDGKKSRLLELPVENELVTSTTDNFRFSAAVASFGMILRNSEFVGDATISSVLAMAKKSKGDDCEGYRAEFIQLVKLAEELELTANK